ncbi:LysR substrate-binding domain-containing protein [Marivita sp. S0852]|uniref:LysR substrate-binding domain-containing protein n=1 Tax=Marivita sp. S0852 TaxID=3373893 RepID=UPI003981D41C
MVSNHSRIVDRALTRLKLRQLRLLVKVGEHGNIQHAARDLGISQPAATKMIQDLEIDFEVQLFERTNRGVVPTVFGEALIRHGKLIFAQVSNAAQELDDLNEGNSGRVVVGTLLAASPTLLPRAIKRLLHTRPNVAIKIVEGTNEALMPALRSGEIDMIVGRLPSHRHRSRIEQETFFDERVMAVAGTQHPLATATNVSFEQLKPFGWILPPIETTLRRQTDQFFIKQGQYLPTTVIESVSYLANRSLLRSHDLVGLLPAHVAALDIEAGLLSAIDWDVPFGGRPVGVSYRGGSSLSPAGSAFLEALREEAATI